MVRFFLFMNWKHQDTVPWKLLIIISSDIASYFSRSWTVFRAMQAALCSMTKVSSLSSRSGQCGACLWKDSGTFLSVIGHLFVFSKIGFFSRKRQTSIGCQVPSIFLCILHNLQLKSSGVRSWLYLGHGDHDNPDGSVPPFLNNSSDLNFLHCPRCQNTGDGKRLMIDSFVFFVPLADWFIQKHVNCIWLFVS